MKDNNTQKTSPQSFYDSSWHKWLDMKKYGPMSRHTRRLCSNIIAGLDFGSVLDIGCGGGLFLSHLAGLKPNARLYGIDIAQSAVDTARKNVPSADFHVLDVEKEALPVIYDLVTVIDVIEHIKDDERFLKNVRGMTGKYLLIRTLTGRMRAIEEEVGHVRNYSDKELVKKLTAAGFSVVSVRKWGFPFYSPLYRTILSFRAPQQATLGTYGKLRKLLAELLYNLFFLNIPGRGDVIMILAKPS